MDKTPRQISSCHACGSTNVEVVEGRLRLVSSDVRPVDGTTSWLACRSCGLAQKSTDAQWRAMVGNIYANYEIYHQVEAEEQLVFSAGRGGTPRSALVLDILASRLGLADSGDLLDFGCANGVLLRRFRQFRPGWSLTGAEINDRHGPAVKAAVPGVRFFGDGRTEFGTRFDLIILNHVLEHIPGPVATLAALARQCKPGGALCIVVPHLESNPFDLLIADHCSHFRPADLHRLLSSAGWQVSHALVDDLPKEIMFIARPSADEARMPGNGERPEDAPSAAILRMHLAWLEASRRQMEAIAGDFAVFGSSIAACWCLAEFGERVRFFIDEDPARQGHELGGRKIFLPENAPTGLPLYYALAPVAAKRVSHRLAHRFPDAVLPAPLFSQTQKSHAT